MIQKNKVTQQTQPRATGSAGASRRRPHPPSVEAEKKTPTAPKKSSFVVFYSWQSDLPDETNRRIIREALRDASSRLEEAFSQRQLRVVVDEATRGKPGSPNIPETILEKIRGADVFVCDITTINVGRPVDHRAVPNPNVAIELGYAVAHLGWNRIVMLFNTAHGTFPGDAPFDIDRHRASPYHFPKELESEFQPSKKERAAAVNRAAPEQRA